MLKKYIYFLFTLYISELMPQTYVFLSTYVYSIFIFCLHFLKYAAWYFASMLYNHGAVHVWQTTRLLVRRLWKRELRTGVIGSKLTCKPHVLCEISNKVIFDLSFSFPVLVMMFLALHSHFAAVLSSFETKGKHSTCCTLFQWKTNQWLKSFSQKGGQRCFHHSQ